MDCVQNWTNSLLDMLEYTHRRAMGSMEMSAASATASRWKAIDATTSPTDKDDQVLPGLFVGRKMNKPNIKVRESVLRELNQALYQKLGTTGISLFSVQCDKPMIAEAFACGIDALAADINPGLTVATPLTTVEHDNLQLTWNRSSRNHPHIKVPNCLHADDDPSIFCPCFATKLPSNQGPLPMWLSPSQQLLFDETGELPPRCPCLLCIRSGLQELVLLYGKDTNPMRMSSRQLVNPPFKILVDHPGGYRSEFCTTPASSQVVSTPFPRNCGSYCVRCNETGDRWYVDQQQMVYTISSESLN